MNNELRQALNKIIELSKNSTLCCHLSNNAINISFAITDDLILTEQSTGDSFSIWFSVEGMATPTEINLKYDNMESFEYLTSAEISQRSNDECHYEALELKLVDGSQLTIFEDVA